MEIKIKVDVLTKLNLVSLMWHKKKPIDGVSNLPASLIIQRLLLVKNELLFCLEYSLGISLKEIL